MPNDIVAIASAQMKLPVRIEVAPQGTAATRVTQEVFFVPKPDKHRLLEKVLGEYHGAVLVFSRTKFGAKKIAMGIRAMGHTAAELHSNKSLSQRRDALDGFRNGKYRVLVATDIAARGIDVKGIELVLNYDLPMSAEDYVHRIGRTGRAGGVGHAISFATPDQKFDLRKIERLIRGTLPLSKLPELPPARILPEPAREPMPFAGRSHYATSRRPAGNAHHNGRPARPPFRSSSSSSTHSTRPQPRRFR
jgi:ATP-dependent RNA helicase RhlE